MLLRRDENEATVTIEMMPLIDMVFLLLIFFLVATTFHQTEREMQIALPFAESSGPISAALREIVINVDEDGQMIIAGQTMEAEAVESMIQEAVAANPEQKVTLRGDRRVAYGQIVTVLDLCKRSGIQEPYLDTVLE